jgi:hypothetical protein
MHLAYGAGMIVRACRLLVAKPELRDERDELEPVWPRG